MPIRTPGSQARSIGRAEASDDFRERFEALRERHVRLWLATSAEPPRLGPPVGIWRRYRNARATRRLIGEIAHKVEEHPDRSEEVAGWREQLRERVQRFGEQRFGWPAGYRSLAFGEDFYETTAAFVRRARRFDPEIRMTDVGQAMRNVWIVNSLQMLFDDPVALAPATFSYSMLYPYTDNLLDDPTVGVEKKRGMNERLGRWLVGEWPEPRGELERRIRDLVASIDADYSRERFPQVFESLQAIHQCQVESLRLQGLGRRSHNTILEIQVGKGGASVLADGYLARGRLDAAQEDFCFGYGVLLQFLDDLQDVVVDREADHATLFSVEAGQAPLDPLVSRLNGYMRSVIEDSELLASPDFADRKDLIRRNCTLLMVSAVAENPELFSRGFRGALQRRWPLGFRAMRSLRRFAENRLGRARRALERRKNVESLWDLVGEG